MLKCRVLGNATSTVKHPSMRGWKLLVVQPLMADGSPDGDPLVAVDSLGAGTEEIVMITSDGKSTSELMGADNTPVRWAVIGLADR